MDSEIIIVAIGATLLFGVMPLIISISSYKEKKLKLQMKGGGEEMQREFEAMKSEVLHLRERVAVLEKLATDEDRKLAGDIERLRRADARPGA